MRGGIILRPLSFSMKLLSLKPPVILFNQTNSVDDNIVGVIKATEANNALQNKLDFLYESVDEYNKFNVFTCTYLYMESIDEVQNI